MCLFWDVHQQCSTQSIFGVKFYLLLPGPPASSLGKSRGPRALVGSALLGSSAVLRAPQVPDPLQGGAGEGWELAFATLLPKIPWVEPRSVAPWAVTGAGAHARRAGLGFWDLLEKPTVFWGEKKRFLSKGGNIGPWGG